MRITIELTIHYKNNYYPNYYNDYYDYLIENGYNPSYCDDYINNEVFDPENSDGGTPDKLITLLIISSDLVTDIDMINDIYLKLMHLDKISRIHKNRNQEVNFKLLESSVNFNRINISCYNEKISNFIMNKKSVNINNSIEYIKNTYSKIKIKFDKKNEFPVFLSIWFSPFNDIVECFNFNKDLINKFKYFKHSDVYLICE